MNQVLLALIEKYLGTAFAAVEPALIQDGKKLAIVEATKLLAWANTKVASTKKMLVDAQESETKATLFHGKIWDKIEIKMIEILLLAEEKAIEVLQSEINQLKLDTTSSN